jgi:PKD repeat protein
MKKFYSLLFLTLAFCCINKLNAQASITGDTAVCTGELVNYSVPAGSGVAFGWVPTGGNVIGPAGTNSVNILWGLPGSGTLVVTITNALGGTSFAFLNINIHPKPKPVISYAPYPTCSNPVDTSKNSTGQNPDRQPCIKVCEKATILYSTPLHAGSTYNWIVNGETIFTGQGTNAVNVTWDTTLFGSLTVVETNVWGCTDSNTICLEKIKLPKALANCNSNVCRNTATYFVNQSTGATDYYWTFGDGGTSTAVNPSHIYTTAGTYPVTLIAENSCHCRDTFYCSVTVDALPGPDIECPATVCAGDTQTYSTNAAGCSYQWGVVGGTILGPANTPSITVAWGPGALGTIWLLTPGCSGLCSDTTFAYITIIPTTTTISGPQKVCDGDCAKYSLPSFGGTTYTWNHTGPGTITCGQGCHEIELCRPMVFSNYRDTIFVSYFDSFLNCGGKATLVVFVRGKLRIFGNNPVCTKDPSYYSTSFNCNWSISPAGPTFTGNGTGSIAVNWNGYAGNAIITAVPVAPNQVCNDSASFAVQVLASPPAPDIAGDTIVCPGNTYSYCTTATQNVQWTIVGGTPASGSGSCISVTWNMTGPYAIYAAQQSQSQPSCISDTTLQNIYSALPLATPVVTGLPTACANNTIPYNCTTLYPAGASYSWSISPANSGAIISGQGTNSIQVEWGNNAPATVTVSLSVTVCNQQVTGIKTVTLNLQPPFTIAQLGNLCPGGTAALQVSSSFPSYAWSGPGGYTAAVNPAPITQSGLYQVTITNGPGCTARKIFNAVGSPLPTASISTADPTNYCTGATFAVTLHALGNPNYSFAWSNGPVTQNNTVTTTGSFNVTVTDNSTGCMATSNTITVSTSPCTPVNCTPAFPITVSFTHPIVPACNPVSFNNTSAGPTSYSWNFGDGQFSNAASPTHTYLQAGFYLVVLTGYVPNTAGTDSCFLTDTAHIEVPLAPRFTSGGTCDSICFTDLSTTTAGNNITSWSWNFGDLTPVSLTQNPCHVYASGGVYNVALTISNGTCTSTITNAITVAGNPVAAFTFNDTTCIGTPVLFTDASTPAANIFVWNWNFGDGGTSLNQSPQHAYVPNGTYPITFWVEDIYGCRDSLLDTVFVAPPSLSGNIAAYPDTIVCAGENVLLIAPACASCTYSWSNGGTNDSISVNTTGIYAVTITDINGCNYSTYIRITVLPPPPATIWNTRPDQFCESDDFASLQVQYNVNYNYLWTTNDLPNNGSTNSGVGTSFATPAGTYTYQVIITDTSTGCTDTSLPYTIIIHPKPVAPTITITGSPAACAGDTIILYATHPDTAVTFQWNTDEITDTIGATQNGCYAVTVTNNFGCKNDTTQCITIYEAPCVEQFWTGCLDTCSPFLMNAPAGYAAYQWLYNDTVIAGATAQTYTATVNGNYSVILTTVNGCIDTTGYLELTLHVCDTGCAFLIPDTIYCDKNGNYVFQYYIQNNTSNTIDETTLQILPPHISLLYAPVTQYPTIAPNSLSGLLTATIYNGQAGDTLCFLSHIHTHNTLGQEIFCCPSDTVCITLPHCDTIHCNLEYQDTICRGMVATYSYPSPVTGYTYNWYFPGATPATATGPGPHNINLVGGGCKPFTLIIIHNGQSDTCRGQTCIIPNITVTIAQVGNTLQASGPAGVTYQWYSKNPALTLLPGQTNQFLNPAGDGVYCVVITNQHGCKDTTCIDYIKTAIDDISKGGDWQLYPNPTENFFRIAFSEFSNNLMTIEVFDVMGKKVAQKQLLNDQQNKVVLFDQYLAKGVYTVNVKTENTLSVKRLIVE